MILTPYKSNSKFEFLVTQLTFANVYLKFNKKVVLITLSKHGKHSLNTYVNPTLSDLYSAQLMYNDFGHYTYTFDSKQSHFHMTLD